MDQIWNIDVAKERNMLLEDAICKLVQAGESKRSTARRLGCCESQVFKVTKKRGIASLHKRGRPKQTVATMDLSPVSRNTPRLETTPCTGDDVVTRRRREMREIIGHVYE